MPIFVYDVKGWAWHHKAEALAAQFDDAAVRAEDELCGVIKRPVVFFSPQQYERCRKSLPFVSAFVGASFPAELPALAALDGKVAGLFVNNRRMHDALTAIGVPAYCIPNGVDCEFWIPRNPPHKNAGPLRVGWVGNSRHWTHGGRRPHKGFEMIAEAAALAGVTLTARDTAGEYGGVAYWTREQIRERIYHEIDVLAVASEMEGTPNPALEAWACGVPVITTPVGDAAELIATQRMGGWIVDRCVESFALMFGHIARADLRREGENGRQMARTLRSWSAAADQFRAMFAEAAARKEVRKP